MKIFEKFGGIKISTEWNENTSSLLLFGYV